MNQQDIEQVVKAVLLKIKAVTRRPPPFMRWAFSRPWRRRCGSQNCPARVKKRGNAPLAIAAIREAGEKHARDLAELPSVKPAWAALKINLPKTSLSARHARR